MSMTGYEETSFRKREVTETLQYSPELAEVVCPPGVSKRIDHHEAKDLVDYASDHTAFRKEFKTQTTHNIIQVDSKQVDKMLDIS